MLFDEIKNRIFNIKTETETEVTFYVKAGPQPKHQYWVLRYLFGNEKRGYEKHPKADFHGSYNGILKYLSEIGLPIEGKNQKRQETNLRHLVERYDRACLNASIDAAIEDLPKEMWIWVDLVQGKGFRIIDKPKKVGEKRSEFKKKREKQISAGEETEKKFDKPNRLKGLIEWIEDQREGKHYIPRKLSELEELSERKGHQEESGEKHLWTTEELLSSNRDFVVLGEPGIGKSTILMELALQLAKNEDERIPVYVDLRSYSGGGKEELLNEIKEQSHDRGINLSYKELVEEKSLFLLDHLDRTNRAVVDDINELTRQEPYSKKDRFIVGCRINFDFYHKNVRESQFTSIVIQHLDPNDVRGILRDNNIEELHRNYNRNNRMLGLCRTPLLLDMMIEIYRDKKKKGEE